MYCHTIGRYISKLRICILLQELLWSNVILFKLQSKPAERVWSCTLFCPLGGQGHIQAAHTGITCQNAVNSHLTKSVFILCCRVPDNQLSHPEQRFILTWEDVAVRSISLLLTAFMLCLTLSHWWMLAFLLSSFCTGKDQPMSARYYWLLCTCYQCCGDLDITFVKVTSQTQHNSINLILLLLNENS